MTDKKVKGPYLYTIGKIKKAFKVMAQSRRDALYVWMGKELEQKKTDRRKAIKLLTAVARKEAKRLGFDVRRVCLKR